MQCFMHDSVRDDWISKNVYITPDLQKQVYNTSSLWDFSRITENRLLQMSANYCRVVKVIQL